MRRGGAIAVVVVVLAILSWAALAGADPPAGTLTTYAIPTPMAGPADLVAGPDEHPWFVETATDNVGTVSAGKVSEYDGNDDGRADSIASASGLLWFAWTDGDTGKSGLDSVTTAGVVSEQTSLLDSVGGIAADSGGDLWITHPDDDQVDEVAAPAYSSEVDPEENDPLPAYADPTSIATGPDGTTMWFTEPEIESVASITAQGSVTQYPLPDDVTGTLGEIVLGADGNLWVGVSAPDGSPATRANAGLSVSVAAATLRQPSAVLRITPAGLVSEFDLPSGSNADPSILAAGPDGQLWMPDTDGGLTTLTSSGSFITYPGVLPATATITSMIKDPGGADALWLTDAANDAVYDVALTPPTTSASSSTTTSSSNTTPPANTAPPPAPALSATLAPVSAVTKSGATLSGTIYEPAGGASTPVSYDFQYGTTTSYGSATPPATVTGSSAGVPVSVPLSGLTPYTTYHYRLVASDCSTASCQSVSPDQTFTTGSTLAPALNVTVGATTTAGTVLVELPGEHHFERLTVGELIPLGATINARHGTVLIQSAIASGAGEGASGLFSGGVFVVRQPAGTTVTVLALASNFKACVIAHAASAHAATVTAAKKKASRSKKVVNQVFGNAHGDFSTRGHYATAADQGTKWRTADRCDGTLIAVTLGRVTVTDRVRHRSFIVSAGHHYLAKPR